MEKHTRMFLPKDDVAKKGELEHEFLFIRDDEIRLYIRKRVFKIIFSPIIVSLSIFVDFCSAVWLFVSLLFFKVFFVFFL